jgi:uncharacterized protein DUF6082
MRHRPIITSGLGTIAFTICVLLLSPLLLLLVQATLRVPDWEALSSIGQSYTGIAALFAAFALLGVLVTFRAQRQQVQLQQLQAAREMQMQVYRMSLDDELYASAFGVRPGDAEAYRRFRLGVFTNFVFRYLEFNYVTGELSEQEIRSILADENFSAGSSALEWWSERRAQWRPGLTRSREAGFHAVVEEEYQRAREMRGDADVTSD